MKRSTILYNRLLGVLTSWAGLAMWSVVRVELWLPEPTRPDPRERQA